MKYNAGEKVFVSINAMIDGDADMEFVDVVTDHDGEETFYMLFNEFGEMCCLDGEECMIDHVVVGTEDIYDLVNRGDGSDVHFMLTERDLDIATFRNKKKKYRVMVVKYGYADVEAENESDALNLIDDMQENDFDWTDFDDAEIIEEIDY